MSIKTEKSAFHDDTFVAYPSNLLFCIVDTQAQADAILEGLYAMGYAERAVHATSGEEAAERVDLDGVQSGIRARIVRAIQRLGGEYEAMETYVAAMADGRTVVTAPVDDDEDRAAVVALYREHGGEQLTHFKPAVVEYL